MGNLRLVRVHTPSETIEIPGDRVLGVDVSKGFPAVAWREGEAGVVKFFGGAIELHEDEAAIVVPTLSVVPPT